MKFAVKILPALMTASIMCLPMQAQMNGHSAAAQAANDPNHNGMAPVQSNENMDAMFLKDAAGANLAEVAAGQMANTKSTNDDVKAFAQHMIDDHAAMQKDVESAASSLHVTLPTTPPKADQAQAKKLDAMNGAAFDKAYVAAQVKGHKKVLGEMKHESSTTQNAQLRDLSSKASQKVAEHLKMAEDLEAKVGKP